MSEVAYKSDFTPVTPVLSIGKGHIPANWNEKIAGYAKIFDPNNTV